MPIETRKSVTAYLLAFTSPHLRWFGTLVIDIGPKIFGFGFRGRLGLLDSLLDDSPGFLFNDLERHQLLVNHILTKGGKFKP